MSGLPIPVHTMACVKALSTRQSSKQPCYKSLPQRHAPIIHCAWHPQLPPQPKPQTPFVGPWTEHCPLYSRPLVQTHKRLPAPPAQCLRADSSPWCRFAYWTLGTAWWWSGPSSGKPALGAPQPMPSPLLQQPRKAALQVGLQNIRQRTPVPCSAAAVLTRQMSRNPDGTQLGP